MPKIFIAGCGRSGTTLIRDLMNNYKDTYVLVEGPHGESPYQRFESLHRPEANVVIKREGDSWKTLASLPADIGLIYCVRHPFDTLTSTHPETEHLRRFHVTEGRWASEYLALQALRIAQPDRRIFILKYEDLVHRPNAIQEEIARHFSLESSIAFSHPANEVSIITRSVEKWHHNPDFHAYCMSFPDSFKSLIRKFCQEFNYVLPAGYGEAGSTREFQYRFSIIIPLEFHRGQIEKCLNGWVNGQTYDRESYEILAAGCTTSLSDEDISVIQGMLGPHDRLLLYEHPHDMALCASASLEARGETLVFTESHCLPDSDLLEVANRKLSAHPEWAGFSGSARRLTYTTLSVVEADMYQGDIRYGLTSHPWRKILDQVFVIRNENYRSAGGFVPELGHFAEWHLAARMHEKEYLIEYEPEVRVSHYYTGDQAELIEFTRDFTEGEMKYKAEFVNDACQSYFPEADEWRARFSWIPHLARKAFALSWNTGSGAVFLHPTEMILRMYLTLSWCVHLFPGIKFVTFWAAARTHVMLVMLKAASFLNFNRKTMSAIFLRLIDATIRLARIKHIQNWLALPQDQPLPVQNNSFRWLPDIDFKDAHILGIYPSEAWQGISFKWSEPVAMMEMTMQPGQYRFSMDWLPIRPIRNLRIYLNEKPLVLAHSQGRAEGTFTVSSKEPVRFAWTCEPWTKPRNEPRILGLPVKSISWMKAES